MVLEDRWISPKLDELLIEKLGQEEFDRKFPRTANQPQTSNADRSSGQTMGTSSPVVDDPTEQG